MSVQAYQTARGERYRVRWREGTEKKMRSRSFDERDDAEEWDDELRRRRLREKPPPPPGWKMSLGDAYKQWWHDVGSKRAENTRRSYQAVWGAYVPALTTDRPLGDFAESTRATYDLRDQLDEQGVGASSQRKILWMLSAVLTYSVRQGWVANNPVRFVEKPSLGGPRFPRPFAPIVVERIRAELLDRETKDSSGAVRVGDATLVSVLAYAGLRPQEALALQWRDVLAGQLTIEKAVAYGVIKDTKTRRNRSVSLAGPLREDLAEWRRVSRPESEMSLVFPGHDGNPWSRTALDNWRARVWQPAVEQVADSLKKPGAQTGKLSRRRREDERAAGKEEKREARSDDEDPIANARPYTLRSSFVSLHLRAGRPPLEVAAEAGHSPQVMFNHYAAVINELKDEPGSSADAAIRQARAKLAEGDKETIDEIIVREMKPRTPEQTRALRLLYGKPGAIRQLRRSGAQ